MPIFSAAHRPSSLLRRALAFESDSSSIANFFSKPSSRLSNVVMSPSSLTFGILSQATDFARFAQRPRPRQGNPPVLQLVRCAGEEVGLCRLYYPSRSDRFWV